MIEDIKPLIGKLTSFASQRMGFERAPKLFLRKDSKNSNKMLGRTAHYDPGQESVTLFITGRHPKDILRSLAHELVHHTQNLRGEFDREMDTSPGYAQKDNHMRDMEKEAYLDGNMCFRDWEDSLDDKDTYTMKLAESKFLKENKTMTTKTRVTKELLQEMIEKQLKKSLEEGGVTAVAPSHYCIHHGGVQHEGKIVAAEAVQHVEPDENGFISHYDMRLEDGTILENVSASDIQVTSASLAEAHHARSDKHKPMKKKVKETEEVDGEVVEEETEELEEGDIPQGLKDYMKKKEKKDKKEPAGMTDPDAPMSVPADDEDPPAKEGEKPDIGDIDGDGNKDESAKGAAKDKEAKEKEKKPKEKREESKIRTPEQENTLYEQRFTPKNNRLFNKLIEQWTK